MADEHDFTIGKMIETEINNFLQEFSQSRCGMHIPVLLFPIGLPPNVLRVIRYIAMLFDLVAIRVGPEGAQTLAIVHPHHLRFPYSQHIGYYFGYEDALYNTPYIYEEFRDMLKWSFIKFIESSQRNRTKYDSILRVMRKIPPNQTDEVSTSEDQSASDTSGYSRAEPGTSAGASQSILTYQTDDQEVSTMEDSDTSAYDQTLPSTSTNTTQIIPHNPTDDQAVLSSKDKSVSDTSADNPAEPGTSTGICEPTATASDGVVQNVPQNLPDIQEEYCSEEESVSGTSAYDPAEPSTSANDSELTTTTSTDTVQPRTLNAHAEEQQPALEPPRSSTPTWEDWVKMIPSRELIHEIYQYVACSIVVVGKQNYFRLMTRSVYNMDYIIELTHNLNWLILNDGSHRLNSIRRIYRENPYYVKFFDHQSLLVARSVGQARRLLAVQNSEIQARPFDQANPLCVLLAYYGRLAPARGGTSK